MCLFEDNCGNSVSKEHLVTIVAKKWEPGNLVPSRFSAQIRKVEARLGKLAKIRKIEINLESSSKRLGKLEVRPKKNPHLILVVGN